MGRHKKETVPNGHFHEAHGAPHQSESRLVVERIQRTILKKKEELAEVEERVRTLKKDIQDWTWALGGSPVGIEQSIREAQTEEEPKREVVSPFKTPPLRRKYNKHVEKPQRNVTDKLRQTARNNRANSPDWTPEEDSTLVNFFRESAKPVPATAREAALVLPSRSEKAITQRMYRLAKGGALRRAGGGGTRTLMMEAV